MYEKLKELLRFSEMIGNIKTVNLTPSSEYCCEGRISISGTTEDGRGFELLLSAEGKADA